MRGPKGKHDLWNNYISTSDKHNEHFGIESPIQELFEVLYVRFSSNGNKTDKILTLVVLSIFLLAFPPYIIGIILIDSFLSQLFLLTIWCIHFPLGLFYNIILMNVLYATVWLCHWVFNGIPQVENSYFQFFNIINNAMENILVIKF